MSLEDDLFAQRLRRTAEIEALGFRAYGQRFDASHTIPQILADYSAKTAEELADKPRVHIAGRILTVRRMGKAGFMHLMQLGERLQVYVRKDAVPEADYSLYEGLDLGDIVGVDGYLFRTRTGELSVHVECLDIPSPGMQPRAEREAPRVQPGALRRQTRTAEAYASGCAEVCDRRGEGVQGRGRERGHVRSQTRRRGHHRRR